MHGGMTLKERGEQAQMHYGAAAMAVRRFAARACRDKKLAALRAKVVKEVFGENPGNVQC
jgi:hypothetical protein